MAESATPKVRRDGTLVVQDSGAANSYTIQYVDGDLSFTDSVADRVVVRKRGDIYAVRKGDTPVLTATFTAHFHEFRNGSSVTLWDALRGVNGASSWTSVAASSFTDFDHMNDFVFTVEGSDFGESADGTATLNRCLVTDIAFSEGDPSQASITIEIYNGITYTGQA